MGTWKLGEYRDLVDRLCTSDHAKRAKVAADSVAWKLSLAGYHAEESRNAALSIAPNLIEGVRQLLEASKGGEPAKEFREATFESEAHLIACAHAGGFTRKCSSTAAPS